MQRPEKDEKNRLDHTSKKRKRASLATAKNAKRTGKKGRKSKRSKPAKSKRTKKTNSRVNEGQDVDVKPQIAKEREQRARAQAEKAAGISIRRWPHLRILAQRPGRQVLRAP